MFLLYSTVGKAFCKAKTTAIMHCSKKLLSECFNINILVFIPMEVSGKLAQKSFVEKVDIG